MAIIINKLAFTNYRQYGTGALTFNTSDKGMLSVFIAKNGTGKTTILNAITWCLYGSELHLPDENRALPIVTSAVKKAADNGEVIPVEVVLTITDKENVVEFKRTEAFKVTTDANGDNHVIPGCSQLEVTTTKIGTFANTEIKTGNDADIIVKRYFDEAIFKFYFFDGEKLRDYFTASQANSIQQSIFNISQVTLLENSCHRLRNIHAEKMRKLERDFPDIKNLRDEEIEQRKQLSTAIDMKAYNQQTIDRLTKEREEVEDKLRGYKPVENLQKERDTLISSLCKTETEEEVLRGIRTAFIRKYEVILSLYPRIKQSLKIIKEKESAGDLPPAIDKDLIKKLLVHPEQHCPICDSALDEPAIEHIQKLLAKFSVSSQTSNYLKEIKGFLEVAIDDVADFKSKLSEIREKEIDISARKDSTEKRLSEIAAELSNFENIAGQVNVTEEESKRTELIDKIADANQAIGAAEALIGNCQNELQKIEENRNEALKKMREHEDIREQVAVIDALEKRFGRIKSVIIDDMKREIERSTWRFFDKMIWKKNTFGRIAISDSYNISVYDQEGVEMIGSLSATEQMALAYAFTLAIHNASGRNCPLVIDSPLGRVSDTNRENMAAVLKEVSKKKQIIMLFTPDEYSEEVRNIYEGTAVVKELILSEDENYVEGIEH